MIENHRYTHRVRYADTDRMGVVYHGRYFEWFEAARTEMLRDAGLPYAKLEERGVMLPVIEVHCQYIRSVLYDELVTIQTSIVEATRSRLVLEYAISLEGEDRPRAVATTVHCYMSPEGRAIRAPQSLMDIFQNPGEER